MTISSLYYLNKKVSLFIVPVTFCFIFTSCGRVTSNGNGKIQTEISPELNPISIPEADSGNSYKNPSELKTCVNSDINHLCLGVKMVSYLNGNIPVISLKEAQTLTESLNTVWSQCNIGFQLEKYEMVDPVSKNLSYNTNWIANGDKVRAAFEEPNTFLIVSVGSLDGSTIAVTQMPGYGPFGVLVESLYAKNPFTVGHELGHYMGLYHLNDSSNLMNAYIGSNTSGLSASQCKTARSTNLSNWPQMLRN